MLQARGYWLWLWWCRISCNRYLLLLLWLRPVRAPSWEGGNLNIFIFSCNTNSDNNPDTTTNSNSNVSDSSTTSTSDVSDTTTSAAGLLYLNRNECNRNGPRMNLDTFLGDALRCYSCEFTEGPYACDHHHIMTCTNSTYCLSKYAIVNDQDTWGHSCAQDLFEDDWLGMSWIFTGSHCIDSF